MTSGSSASKWSHTTWTSHLITTLVYKEMKEVRTGYSLSLPFFPNRKLTIKSYNQDQGGLTIHNTQSYYRSLKKYKHTQFCAKNLNEAIYMLNIPYLILNGLHSKQENCHKETRFCYCWFYFFLIQGFSMLPWLAWNWPYKPGWPRTDRVLPAYASIMLRIKGMGHHT